MSKAESARPQPEPGRPNDPSPPMLSYHSGFNELANIRDRRRESNRQVAASFVLMLFIFLTAITVSMPILFFSSDRRDQNAEAYLCVGATMALAVLTFMLYLNLGRPPNT